MSARDAAIRAVQEHPSTTFMAPCESLADAVLAAASPLIRAEVLREAAQLLRNERANHNSRAIFCEGLTHGAQLLDEMADQGKDGAQ
ncbi:hypothetical protein H1V43_32440 [Streptomyces sp. PSKA54]|uniref:Uncharacterized protein n=1 Tax=Streptomyces himalayensis subsp. aureolus TaxID=2758039 RepID=A0A7W2D7A0_9ACTN|nr:hypothetical protein [Streptomyces himalayensis]MBA4865973.1 hypothetical protein [Streptomyces himalayensis subsp. aureolus]